MITVSVPTRFSEVQHLLLPSWVRGKSWFRRLVNSRASATTIAALRMQFVFLGQEGIGELDSPAMIDKPLGQYTEREACALIAACRDRFRAHVRAFNEYDPRGGVA